MVFVILPLLRIHLATNSLAKRFVQTFKCTMSAFESDLSTEEKLARFLLSYRNTQHSTTNVSPAELMLGRMVRTRLDLLRPDLRQSVRKRQEQQDVRPNSTPRRVEEGGPVMVRDYLSSNK